MIRNLKKLILIASTGAVFQFGGDGCLRWLGDLTTDLLFLNLHPDLV